MRYFRVLLLGEHYKLTWLNRPRFMGFYVTRFVECSSIEEAQSLALASIRSDESLNSMVMNDEHDPPSLRVDSLEEISKFDFAETPPGFVYFEEK